MSRFDHRPSPSVGHFAPFPHDDDPDDGRFAAPGGRCHGILADHDEPQKDGAGQIAPCTAINSTPDDFGPPDHRVKVLLAPQCLK